MPLLLALILALIVIVVGLGLNLTTLRADGNTLLYENDSSADIASDGVVLLKSGVDGGIGIAINDIEADASGPVMITGVHELAAETGVAWEEFDRLYWDGTKLTKTSSTNTYAGRAYAVKASADAVGQVILNHNAGFAV